MIPAEARIPYKAIGEASRAIDDDAYALIGWEGITRILESAAPHMVDKRGAGDYLPGWDDRKTLAGIWQEHAMLPVEGLSDGVYSALIAVATWGYQQRKDEEL